MAGPGLLNGRARAATSRAPAVSARAASGASGLTPYLDPMPTLVDNAVDATGGGTVRLTTALISRKVHSELPATTLFGYLRQGGPGAGDTAASYLGPAIVAKSGTAVKVRYTNGLARNDFLKVFTNGGASYLQFASFPEVRILSHLHGGFVAGDDDGNPFTQPDAFRSGKTQSVTYPNEQPATLLWYHDHYNGATRMNVVAGLAGGYLIRDSFDTGTNPLLPGPLGTYELVMVVQDRQFNADGSLLYPVAAASTNGPWIGEYFGDVMLVNGKIWPKLTVEPAVYRFRVLNGCNARIVDLQISAPDGTAVPMTIVGTEGGLLPVNPASSSGLVMTPAERYDVICDFRGFDGQTLLMTNTDPPDPVSTRPPLPQVMQITVKQTALSGAPMNVPGSGSLPRNLTVRRWSPGAAEAERRGGRDADDHAERGRSGDSELEAEPQRASVRRPQPGDRDAEVEQRRGRYFVNTTGDTHPMHTHLFTFHVMGRYNCDIEGYVKANGGPNGVRSWTSPPGAVPAGDDPPDENEAGLKETVKVNPEQVTVVRAILAAQHASTAQVSS